MFWSYILMAFGVVGLLLVGQKYRAGWIIGLAAQGLWVAYALATSQYGFLLSAVAYGIANVLGLRRSLREKSDGDQGQVWQTLGHLNDEGVTEPIEEKEDPWVRFVRTQAEHVSEMRRLAREEEERLAELLREERREDIRKVLAEFRDSPSSFVREVSLDDFDVDRNKTATLPNTDFEDWKKDLALLPNLWLVANSRSEINQWEQDNANYSGRTHRYIYVTSVQDAEGAKMESSNTIMIGDVNPELRAIVERNLELDESSKFFQKQREDIAEGKTPEPWWLKRLSVECAYNEHVVCTGDTHSPTSADTDCECACHETKETNE